MKKIIYIFGLLIVILLLNEIDSYSQNVYVRYYKQYSNGYFKDYLTSFEKKDIMSYWKVIVNASFLPVKAEYYQDKVLKKVFDFSSGKVYREEIYQFGLLKKINLYNNSSKRTIKLDYWETDIFLKDNITAYWQIFFDSRTKKNVLANLIIHNKKTIKNIYPPYNIEGPFIAKIYFNSDGYPYRQENYDFRNMYNYGDKLNWNKATINKIWDIHTIKQFPDPNEAKSDELTSFYNDQNLYRKAYYFHYYEEFDEDNFKFYEKIPRGLAPLKNCYMVAKDIRGLPIYGFSYFTINDFNQKKKEYFEFKINKHDTISKLSIKYLLKEDNIENRVYTNIYNKKGYIKEKTLSLIRSDDNIINYGNWSYDYRTFDNEKTFVPKEILFYKYGKLYLKKVFTYNKSNKCSNIRYYDKVNNLISEKIYEYDRINRLIKKINYQNNSLFSYYKYDYDALGRILKITFYNQKQNNIVFRINNSYNQKGYLSCKLIEHIDKKDEILKVYNEYGKQIYEVYYKEQKPTYKLIFNKKGDVIKQENFIKNQYATSYDFKHFDNGVIKEISVYKNKKHIKTYTFNEIAEGRFSKPQGIINK